MLRLAHQALETFGRFGLRTCSFQMAYRLRRRAGLLKKQFPPQPWPISAPAAWRQWHGAKGGRFFFEDAGVTAEGVVRALEARAKAQLIREADDVVRGRFRYFSHLLAHVGTPPDWFENPFTKQRSSNSRHWCDISEFALQQGDIKFIWELSRFAWALVLARAYVVTRDGKYPETFWSLFEDWVEQNPPQMGPHWMSGQECAFRIVALCFCLNVFRNAPATTDKRASRLIAAVGVHARRIERNIEFALSLKNSHGISEAMGLYTAGVLFPALPRARDWRERGRNLLIREGLRQIYPDGSFVQHSMNYHRLILHSFLWAGRLAELNGDSYPPELTERLRTSTNFMYQMLDEKTGRVPNYGPNDGVCLLGLNGCDYLDYRPLVQSMSYFVERRLLFKPGRWDENLVWLFGTNALKAAQSEQRRVAFSADCGGYYSLHGPNSWGLLRCHTYRDRPLQADMLHLDLWYRGINIMRDSGSFQYFCDRPWEDYFKSTAAHNTIEMNKRDQMEKAGRFLWLGWVKAQLRHNEELVEKGISYWEGEHYGYRRSRCRAVHRRAVVRWRDRWVVIDDLLGWGEAEATLRWHLADLNWRGSAQQGLFNPEHGIRLMVSAPIAERIQGDVMRGVKRPRPEGWESLYYGERRPLPTALYCVSGRLPVRIITIVDCDGAAEWNLTDERIEGRAEGARLAVRLLTPSESSSRVAAVGTST